MRESMASFIVLLLTKSNTFPRIFAVKLTVYIKKDLQQRIRSGRSVPRKLTLAGLSEHYGASLTPVRTAVGELVAEGYIRKLANGRLAVNAERVGTGGPSETPSAPRTPEDWDEILVRDVALASLGRSAIYLREEALAQKHGVGRSVIRQALSRIAGAGLIEHVPRCGWLVHPLREQDVRAYLEAREVLELKALDLARPHLVPADLQGMLEGNPAPATDRPPRLDNRLHQYLIDKSGNRYIRDFFQQHVAQYYATLFDHAAPETSVVAEMAAQHRQILEALIQRDWPASRRAISDHVRSQGLVLHMLLELPAREAGPGDSCARYTP